jgi:hypothetical protein
MKTLRSPVGQAFWLAAGLLPGEDSVGPTCGNRIFSGAVTRVLTALNFSPAFSRPSLSRPEDYNEVVIAGTRRPVADAVARASYYGAIVEDDACYVS